MREIMLKNKTYVINKSLQISAYWIKFNEREAIYRIRSILCQEIYGANVGGLYY